MNEHEIQGPAEMYEQFFGPAIFIPSTEILLEFADPQPGERVLDIACGTGIVTREVAKRVQPGGEVAGLDISPEMLKVARSIASSQNLDVEWYESSADAIPLPDDAFDLALCQQGLQFFPDQTAALSEMHRVLGENGRAVIKVWKSLDHHPVYRELLQAEADYFGVPVEEVATPFTLGDGDKLRDLFEKVGFTQVTISEVSLDVHFPSPDRFVLLTTLAGAAVMPDFAVDDDDARDDLVNFISDRMQNTIRKHRNGDRLTLRMHANIATGLA